MNSRNDSSYKDYTNQEGIYHNEDEIEWLGQPFPGRNAVTLPAENTYLCIIVGGFRRVV